MNSFNYNGIVLEMYARRNPVRRRANKKRSKRVYKKRSYKPRFRTPAINTASVKECYQLAIPDGNLTFFRSIQLADIIYDRSQAVAAAYQQFRIKYVKMTFKPSADTFPAVAGNIIPQLYFMKDLANAVPLNATADTLYSMGCRSRRMDDKNLVYSWKPSTLIADIVGPAQTTASQIKISPWLSTNANSGNPGAAWAPSTVDHLGCCFYVSKINPNDNVQYTVDVEVVFEFRKPTWEGHQGAEANNLKIENGEVKPMVSTPV